MAAVVSPSVRFRLILCTIALAYSAIRGLDAADLIPVESFEGGTLYQATGERGSGGYNVLSLFGDWHEMGRQYGYLERKRLPEIFRQYMEYLTRKGHTYAEIVQETNTYFDTKMEYVKELVAGMAETSDLNDDQQRIVASGVSWIIESGRCSSMDAWGEYTGGKPLVTGRNWDLTTTNLNPFNRFLTVVVYHPTGSSIPTADINYLGEMLFQSGMNAKGIFLDLQNGAISDRGPSPLPSSRKDNDNDILLTFLLGSATLDALDARFLTYTPGCGLVMNAADEIRGRVYECGTKGMKLRDGTGLLASTNHFIDPDWHLDPPPDGEKGAFTKERLANLLKLGEIGKGRINAEAMRKIFDTTIDRGGPSFPDMTTVYQIVAVPAERTIWLKGTSYSGWVEIPLAPLFGKN